MFCESLKGFGQILTPQGWKNRAHKVRENSYNSWAQNWNTSTTLTKILRTFATFFDKSGKSCTAVEPSPSRHPLVVDATESTTDCSRTSHLRWCLCSDALRPRAGSSWPGRSTGRGSCRTWHRGRALEHRTSESPTRDDSDLKHDTSNRIRKRNSIQTVFERTERWLS